MTTPATDAALAMIDELGARAQEINDGLRKQIEEERELRRGIEARIDAAEEHVRIQETKLLKMQEIVYAASEQANQGLHQMVDELADQLAWFRREHTAADPLMAAFRMVRNGRMTNMSFLEFTNSEAVDKFLQYRNPPIAPHLSSEDVMRELAEARKRLGFKVEGE